MNKKIEIAGHYREGWEIMVSAPMTCLFLEFLRKQNISFTVDVSAVSGSGLFPDTDAFCISPHISEKEVLKWISQFQKKLNK
jgi:hypothetical protein